MVPGSTLRYGSSFCKETVRLRAFRMFPNDAAVIPLPSEETTPPVTKTYFDIATSRAVFQILPGRRPGQTFPLVGSGFRLCSRLQKHQLGVILARRRLHRELRLR